MDKSKLKKPVFLGVWLLLVWLAEWKKWHYLFVALMVVWLVYWLMSFRSSKTVSQDEGPSAAP